MPTVIISKSTENLLNELINKFPKDKWNFLADETGSQKFKYPYIELSDDDCSINTDYWDTDLLGCYHEYKGTTIEGKVKLFNKCIIKCATKYCKDTKGLANKEDDKLLIQNAVNNLTDIVLIHEFVHWIIHWIESKRLVIRYKDVSEDSLNFHEGFAQLFTYLTIKNDDEKLKLFNWLLDNQSEPYKKFKDFIKISESTAIEISESIAIENLFLCKKYDIQSWLIASALYTNNNQINEDFFKEVFNMKEKYDIKINLTDWSFFNRLEKTELIEILKKKYIGPINGIKFGLL